MRAQVAEGLTTISATTFSDRVTLAEALDPDRIAAYRRPSTGTKFRITPRALTAWPLLEHRMRRASREPGRTLHLVQLGTRVRQARGSPSCRDAIASRRVGLEPAPEPAGEARPVCVATNVGDPCGATRRCRPQ